MTVSLRKFMLIVITLTALLLSSYSSAALSVNIAHLSMKMSTSTTDHNMTDSPTLVHCPTKDSTSHKHNESTIQIDCCSVSCLVGTAIMPDFSMSSVQLLQFETFPLFTLSYASLVNRSLYRPPIA